MSQYTNQSWRRRPTIGCGISRRSFLADCGMGFAGLAMSAMLEREGIVRAADLPGATGSGADGAWAPPDGRPHFAPRAKNIIWLFMLGGVSHVEGFDPKPALNQFAGKTIDETPHREVLSNPLVRGNVREFVANRQIYNTIYPLQVGFAPRGQSGIDVSDWWPHVGSLVDELAVVRSVWVTDNDHAAQYEFHTGHHLFDGSHPSVGAWIKYGLGSLNDNLPSFIALGEPPGTCCGGLGSQGASYLGPEHNAVQLTIDPANPLPFSSAGPSVSAAEQRAKFELLRDLHSQHAAGGVDDPVLAARIKSYELAFRMQMSVPEALGFADETETTRRRIGTTSPTSTRRCCTSWGSTPDGSRCRAASGWRSTGASRSTRSLLERVGQAAGCDAQKVHLWPPPRPSEKSWQFSDNLCQYAPGSGVSRGGNTRRLGSRRRPRKRRARPPSEGL